MRLADPEEVRAAMAAHMLGSSSSDRPLGTVMLRKHQRDAVGRLSAIVKREGGALLADEVGLGKTFVALALAAELGRPTIVAPASLRAMWRAASARTGVELRFVSMELLGHGGTVPPAELIVVDEAHHFRNPRTRRYARLSEACARSMVLLLTATPVQNQLEDLRNLLGLIVGRQASALDTADLGRLVVRRNASSIQEASALPVVAPPEWISVAEDADCLDQICDLPAPVPPADGDHAATLATFSLVRQWASSRAALMAALTRRLATARAMEDALSAGRQPTRAELRAWRFADGAQQLAFPELASGSDTPSESMLDQVLAHADGLRSLIAWVRCQPDVDRDRARALFAIVRRHAGERVVAFAEFTETVSVLYRHLAPLCRAAMLTHGGGRVAGGAVSRTEVLRQFSPGEAAPDNERIDLLLTTDVLSEGVDLHGASVVIHLDLTWNPARMEQRVGRLRRLGAVRNSIAVYLFEPPAPAERLLQLDRRLRDKLGEAARSIGLAGAILPGIAPSPGVISRREQVIEVLEEWLQPSAERMPVVAAVAAGRPGAIACVRCGGDVCLAAVLDGRVTTDLPLELLRSVVTLDRVRCSHDEVAAAVRHIRSWMQRRSLIEVVQMPAAHVARSRHTILARVNTIARRARRHERSSLTTMLGAARHAATAAMPAGAERVLDELARANLPDDAWLRAVGEFGSIHGRVASAEPDEVLALLILVPTG